MEIVDRVYVALDALEAVGRPGEIGAEQLSSVDVDVRFQQHRKRLALAEMGRFLDCLTGRPMADLGRKLPKQLPAVSVCFARIHRDEPRVIGQRRASDTGTTSWPNRARRTRRTAACWRR
jgi:hypothetical protein